MIQTNTLFEENMKNAWKNPKSIAICFLISYNELYFKNFEKIKDIDATDIQELRFFIQKSEESNFGKSIFENKINAMINQLTIPIVIETINEYQKISGKSIDFNSNFF